MPACKLKQKAIVLLMRSGICYKTLRAVLVLVVEMNALTGSGTMWALPA